MNRFWLISLVVFGVALYFVMRLTNIMNLPLFTDEAIYVRWSQIALNDASWRFISLTDGKQPLYVWITMTLMRFIKDPLFAGRLTSVGAGFFSAIGLFLLTKEVFKKTSIALLASFLYILFPFGLVYDRMALYDGSVATFVPWALWIEILMVRQLKSYQPFIVALIIGAGMLDKSNAEFNLFLLPFTLVLFDWHQKNVKQQLMKWVGFSAIIVVLSEIYYNMLRLSQYFYIIKLKNATFVYPFSQWIHHPFTYFFGNLHGLSDWTFAYTGLVMTVVLVVGLVVRAEFWKEKFVLVVWFAAPFLALALFGRIIYPRWELAMAISLLPIMALAIDWLWQKVREIPSAKKNNAMEFVVCFFIALGLWGQWLYVDYKIITDFAHAPIPQSDLNQYINDWPAGGGAKEIVSLFGRLSAHQKIYVASEGTFGSVPTLALQIYLDNDKNLGKRGIWPTPSVMPADLTQMAKTMPVYYVLNQTQVPPASWHVQFVAKYEKGIGTNYMHVYQVLPN